MGRTVAVVWHASFSAIAAVLYFFFVLPRWWELTGATPHGLGTALRIVAAALIALAALPVVFTLLRTRRPEYGTPQLALTLRLWSIVAHALAGVLIAGTAISEIWLSLDRAGQWLFGIYGAAAAIALLGIGAFALSFVAELPPPPPKPLKPKKPKKPKKPRNSADSAADAEAEATAVIEDAAAPDETADETADETDAAAQTAVIETPESATTSESEQTDLVSAGDREERRPAGKRQAKSNG
jgi:hypothetical protein